MISVALRDTDSVALFKFDLKTNSVIESATYKSSNNNRGLIGRHQVHSILSNTQLIVSHHEKVENANEL